jgi:hypothetical protein
MLMALQPQVRVISEQEVRTTVENFIQQENPALRNLLPEEEQHLSRPERRRREKEERKRNEQKK